VKTRLPVQAAILIAVLMNFAPERVQAEILPELEIKAGIHSTGFERPGRSPVGLLSNYRFGLTAGAIFGPESANPLQYKLYSSVQRTAINSRGLGLSGDDTSLLFGAGAAVMKTVNRFQFALICDYHQEKILLVSSSEVGLPVTALLHPQADLSLLAIGTSSKAFKIGVTAGYYPPSNRSNLKIENGYDFSVYWGIDLGESFGIGYSGRYVSKFLTLTNGESTSSELMIGIKFFKPHVNRARLPMDY